MGDDRIVLFFGVSIITWHVSVNRNHTDYYVRDVATDANQDRTCGIQ